MSKAARNERRANSGTQAGFTLMELVVVMGILAGFLAMLVRFVDSGVTLFQRGESGQRLLDRAQAACRSVRNVLEDLRGPSSSLEPVEDPERLLVQWLPFGLYRDGTARDPHAWFLRGSVQLAPSIESALRERELRAAAVRELGDADEDSIVQRIAELRAATPLVGHGGLWLFPWPQGDDEGAFVELRIGRFLRGQTIESPTGTEVDPMREPIPGSERLPNTLVQLWSEPLVEDLLHCELRLVREAGGASYAVWDSARAGWLGGDGPGFPLDVGPWSLRDPTDDVFPAAIEVTLVLGGDLRLPPDGMLAFGIDADADRLVLLNPDRFEGPEDGGFVKVGPEWIRYSARRGAVLSGLRRGERGTAAGARARGSSVRLGRTVSFLVPLACALEVSDG